MERFKYGFLVESVCLFYNISMFAAKLQQAYFKRL